MDGIERYAEVVDLTVVEHGLPLVEEADLDQVGAEFTTNVGNSCVLHSIDMVIGATPDGVSLQNRHYQLVMDGADLTLEERAAAGVSASLDAIALDMPTPKGGGKGLE